MEGINLKYISVAELPPIIKLPLSLFSRDNQGKQLKARTQVHRGASLHKTHRRRPGAGWPPWRHRPARRRSGRSWSRAGSRSRASRLRRAAACLSSSRRARRSWSLSRPFPRPCGFSASSARCLSFGRSLSFRRSRCLSPRGCSRAAWPSRSAARSRCLASRSGSPGRCSLPSARSASDSRFGFRSLCFFSSLGPED